MQNAHMEMYVKTYAHAIYAHMCVYEHTPWEHKVDTHSDNQSSLLSSMMLC